MASSVWGPPGQESWVAMDDGCELLLRKWEPKGQSVGILHICHGMAEHSARYAELALQFVAEGFTVYAPDHRAHGYTAQRAMDKGVKGHWHGHMEVAGGKDVLLQIVEDNVVLCRRAVEQHSLPLVIMGHSMGSVIATIVASSLQMQGCPSGLILSAAPARLPAALKLVFPPLLRVLQAVHGKAGVAPLIFKLTFEEWNQKFAPNVSDDDWLNRIPGEVKKYSDDPLCGFKCSVGFFRSLQGAFAVASSKETLSKLPKCPVLIIQGGQDPCTMSKTGVNSADQVVEEFRAAGHEVDKRITYGDGRHEIALETCKEEVAQDLIGFVRRHVLSAPIRSRM